MAHTLNGNMTGRAAAEQRVDDRNQALGVPVDTHGYLAKRQKEKEAIGRCIELEGEKSFYAWYTGVDGSISERIELIEERAAILEGEKLYTAVDNMLREEGAHPFKIMDAAEAMKNAVQ